MTTKPKAKLPNPAPPPDAKHEPIDMAKVAKAVDFIQKLPPPSGSAVTVAQAVAALTVTCAVCGHPVACLKETDNRCEVCGHEAK